MKWLPNWFKKGLGLFLAIVITVLVLKAISADPTGSAHKLTHGANTIGNALKGAWAFFSNL